MAVAGSIMFLPGPSVFLSCSLELNISRALWGNFFKFRSNVHLDSRVNWLDLGGQRSKVNFFVASQFSARKILTIIQRHSSGTVTWLVQPWGGKSIYSIDLWYTLELPFHCSVSLQVLRYFDYVFTGVFTFEMIIKVSHCLKIIG